MTYDIEKVKQFIANKWMKKECPICNTSNKWVLADKVFELREYNMGNLIVGGTPIVPVIPIICSECGYTFFLNAKICDDTLLKKNESTNNTESEDAKQQ